MRDHQRIVGLQPARRKPQIEHRAAALPDQGSRIRQQPTTQRGPHAQRTDSDRTPGLPSRHG